ncbi:MAG TPA: SpoIVB peptidase [Clostridiales bacterium]|jgi:stage IV sporulation protein B|nr:SpoIVB peptidase [Clostridiales bacterium]
MINKTKKVAALFASLLILTSALTGLFNVSGGAAGEPAGGSLFASIYIDDFGFGTPAASKNINSIKLYPGGMPFGVKFFTDGVVVVGFCDINNGTGAQNPAYSAGIRVKDIITAINGDELLCAAQLTATIEKSGGKPVTLTYMRDSREYTVTLTPVYSEADGRYKTGIWVRDSGAGIGTVTFIVPSDYSFAGLGHGICDSETGELIPMQRGIVTAVTISGLTRGLPGDPGEIKGYFSSGKCGTLLGNTEHGVYGVFNELPKSIPEDPLPAASKCQVKEGEAYIWCTLDTNSVSKYTVEISAINTGSDSNKCFTITVTDPALLEKTGGIIQGMSGSPIIQNGRIIGAVTHVLINDPTRGYGIFIENMLDNMPDLLKQSYVEE